MKKTFGTALKELRRSKDVSQRELAEKVGVDFSYISKLENDRLPPPSADTIMKICNTLELPAEQLLFESGKISPDMTLAISSSPEALKFMFEAKEMNLTSSEWKTLAQKLKKLR